jgi:inorganic pyrophosphatase
MINLANIETFDDVKGGAVNAIIEVPRGSRNKYTFDPRRGCFALAGVLPAGAVFPFDFGFIPGTLGDDGDPLDILVLMDEPAFAGCVVPSRLIGVIRARQTERDGHTDQNDRLIAVADKSHNLEHVRALADLNKSLLKELEHFFVSFNQVKGKKFRITGRRGGETAIKLVKQGMRRHEKEST